MFLCSRARCRIRHAPPEDTVDIEKIPKPVEVQYILNCGHTLCEKCLYVVSQSEERSYSCDQCDVTTKFSARASTSIKSAKLSSGEKINRINSEFSTELPVDAYSFGLAFSEGLITASKTIETVTSSEEQEKSEMEKFKYSTDAEDAENSSLKELIPKGARAKSLAILSHMRSAINVHAECGTSLKVLGNLEKQLAKEFFEAKMRLRDQFQVLHSLLQLEEMKGLTKFEEIYKRRREEFNQTEKHLRSVRKGISDTFNNEGREYADLLRKGKKLKELSVKPSRINWRNYDLSDEFSYQLDGYCSEVIQNSLSVKNVEKATLLTLEVLENPRKIDTEPLPLFRSPPLKQLVPAPGVSPDSDDLPSVFKENHKYALKTRIYKESRTVVVKIGRVFNPNLFYVMLWTDPDNFKKMRDEIEKWCNKTQTHPPFIQSLKLGAFVFVFYPDTGSWVRARIVKINADPEKNYRRKNESGKLVPSAYSYYSAITIEVQLLDYGGFYLVPSSKVREAFLELFDTEIYPFLAIKCTLFRIAPPGSGNTWPKDEAARVMIEWSKDRALEMTVVRVKGDLHHISLRYYDCPVEVHNNATLKECLLVSDLASGRAENDSFDYHSDHVSFNPPHPIPVNRTEVCLLTTISNPDLFYVTLYADQESFAALHESLKIYFDLPEELYIIYVPRKGMICVALSEGTYYRAEITKLIDSSQVQVLFVDFGTEKVVDVGSLRMIRDEFSRPPIYAIPCRLADIEPIGLKWSNDAIGKFQELCFGDPSGNSHIFNLTVMDHDSKGKHLVNLRRFTGTEYISVNAAMVNLRQARSTGPVSETPTDPTSLNDVNISLDERIFNALEEYDVNGYTILKELVSRNTDARSSKIDSYIKIRVSHWISPDQFYVQITSPEVRSYFICYENKLVKDFCSKLDQPRRSKLRLLVKGTLVAFAQTEDYNHIWRRGEIIEREGIENEVTEKVENDGIETEVVKDTPDTWYNVYARDFGYQIRIQRAKIFKIHSDSIYLKDGDFCIKCHLKDIKPAGGNDWTQTAVEHCDEMLKKHPHRLLLDACAKYLPEDLESPNQSLPVDIIAKETFIPNGLAKQETRYHSFRKTMISKGFAIPTNEIDLSSDREDDDYEEEEPLFKKTSIPYTQRKGDTLLGFIRNARAAAQRKMNNTSVRFYKDAEMPKEQTFIAIPTEVTLDMKIYFRLHKINGLQLINIVNRSISNALKEQDQLLPFAGELIYGRACTAFFDFDKTWNRAEILYPLDENRVFVRFVDYGNEAAVKKEGELSSQIFHPEIRKLALIGLLANCKSNGTDAELLQATIHELIIDHKCVFKWMNFQSLKDMRVSIVMPDGVDLSRYLIANCPLVEEDVTDDQEFVVVPALVREILEKLRTCGYKSSSLKFEENAYYPCVVTGTYRDAYTFIQPKSIGSPANEIEEEIVKRQKEFLAFHKEMRKEVEHYETSKTFKPGEPVVAQFSDYQWYRAMILEKANSIFGDQYRIFYVDYGNTSVVETTKLRKLPAKYLKTPELFAVSVRVCNIKPAKPAEGWTSYLLDLMERETTGNDSKTIALIKSRTDPWAIELHIADPKDPRTPVSSLWKNLVAEGQLIETQSPS